MFILAIDPGTLQSGYAIYDGHIVMESGVLENNEMLALLGRNKQGCQYLAIEKIVSYNARVGQETFDTCVWIGRFIERWYGPDPLLIRRVDVKMICCGTGAAKDRDVRAALLDRIGPQGTKKAPGPTYGVSSHAWAALGVAFAAFEQLTRDSK